MVDIPLSRNINRVSANSGRAIVQAPTNNIGQVLSGAGQDITQVAYNLGQLRQMENEELQANAGYDLQMKITQFRDAEEKAYNAAREGASESGIGFTRQFVEGYQKRADEFVKQNFGGVSESQNAQARQQLLGLGNSLYDKSYAFENQAKSLYYQRTTNNGLDTLRTQIRANAAPSEQIKREGIATINATNMPETWKAARRDEWIKDAEASQWQWEFSQNPRQALSELGVPTKSGAKEGNENAAYQRLIAKGWSPVQAAGIVGNLVQESGGKLNTQARNRGDGSDGSDSVGIAQWNGSRARALRAFAQKQGRDWHDLDVQVDFIDEELRTTEASAGNALRNATNADEAAAAFISFERPAGWSADNPRGGHGWANRLANAQRIAGGGAVGSAPSEKYANLSYEQRTALAEQGERQLQQQAIQERAAVKDRFNLAIQTNPSSVSQQAILSNAYLDDGDKATLINSLQTEQRTNGNVSEFIANLSGGAASVNSFDSEQTKVANRAFEQIIANVPQEQQEAFSAQFAQSTGYIPQPVQAALRQGMSSTQPDVVARAMQNAAIYRQAAPVSFGQMTGGEAIQKKLDLYQTYTNDMGYTPNQAAQRLINMDDPESVRKRESLLKSETVKKAVKNIDSSDVAAVFDKGLFSFAPRIGGNPLSEAAITADYKEYYQEALIDANGDADVAKGVAAERFKRNYGTSELTVPELRGTVIKNAPEVVYPAIDGSHKYIQIQLEQTMSTLGIQHEGVFLQPYADTEKDKKTGIPPAYQVYYMQDGKMQLYPKPFYADVEEAKSVQERRQSNRQKVYAIRRKYKSQEDAAEYEENQSELSSRLEQIRSVRPKPIIEPDNAAQNPVNVSPIQQGREDADL